MKVLLINATFGIGSTGYIVKELYDTLHSEGIETYAFWAINSTSKKNTKYIRRIGTTLDHKIHALMKRFFDKEAYFSLIPTRLVNSSN